MTLGVVEGVEVIVVVVVAVDEVVVVVVEEEDEGSKIARNTELIFGILFRLSLICYYLLKNRLQFSGSSRCMLRYLERFVVYLL